MGAPIGARREILYARRMEAITVAEGTRRLARLQLKQLAVVAAVVVYVVQKGRMSATAYAGLALFFAVSGVFAAWTWRVLPRYDDPRFRITQGGQRVYTAINLWGMRTLSGIGVLFVGFGGLIAATTSFALAFVFFACGFVLMALRPAVVVDLVRRRVTSHPIGTQFPLWSSEASLDDFSGVGVVHVTTVEASGREVHTWRIVLATPDRRRVWVLHEVALGDEEQWTKWCTELGLPKLVASSKAEAA